MPKTKLNSIFVRDIHCPDGRSLVSYFDTVLPGFVLEVRATGGKTYYVRYRDTRSRQRQIKVGIASRLTVDEARTAARKLLGRAALGEDPTADRAVLKTVPTFAEFARDRYLPFIKGQKKSWRVDEGYLRNHMLPHFGKMPLDLITKKTVLAFRDNRRTAGLSASTCNRVMMILHRILALAVNWEIPLVTKNPTDDIPMLRENPPRERYLTEDEAQRLYVAVLKSGNRQLRYIIPMLILTGARKREVMDARWSDFDFDRRQWRIPVTKSGKPRHVPMSDGLIQLLQTIPRIDGCPYVVPNPNTLRPYDSFYFCWNVARCEAGLPDVRVHDLRHSFASFMINAGRSIYEVQKILGHASIVTTQRYAHLSQHTLLEAANTVGNVIGTALGVTGKANGDGPNTD